MSKNKHVSWLEAVVVEGLTPDKLEEAAQTIQNEPECLPYYIRDYNCEEIVARLRKWMKIGLPRSVFNHIKMAQNFPNYHQVEDLLMLARRSNDHAERCSHKHEDFNNSVILRDRWPGRLCQVCGELTKDGEIVVCGGRRRGMQSNRTGYAHLNCLDHLKIQPGEKVVHREVFILGNYQT